LTGEILKRAGFENGVIVIQNLVQEGDLVFVGDHLFELADNAPVFFQGIHDDLGGILGGFDDGVQLFSHGRELVDAIGITVEGGNFLANPLDVAEQGIEIFFKNLEIDFILR